jgi:uncharacterized protein YeaO (DUF488 family)
MVMFVVKTGRVGQQYADSLDVTMKSGTGIGVLLAPTKAMVYRYKAGAGDQRFAKYTALSKAEYTEQYLELLRQRFSTNREAFRQLMQRKSITLQCYCGKGKFCHRCILAEYVLPKLAAYYGIEYQYAGEQ